MASSKRSTISELSAMIQAHTKIIDEHVEASDLKSPSFDDGFPANIPPEVEQARNVILIATDELSDLMLSARQLADGRPHWHTAYIGIQAVNRYRIAEKLGVDEETTFAELAKRCNLLPDDLQRIARLAISRHVFKEPKRGYIAHNAASKQFLDNPGLNDYLSIGLDQLWQAATHMLDAMDKWPGSQEPNHSGFNLAQNTEEAWFESFEARPERRKAFANSMTYMQSDGGFGFSPTHLLTAFDWKTTSKLVDVGGNFGETCKIIMAEHAHIQCVVQDLPNVIAEAKEKAKSDEQALEITFMEHDFFAEMQPVTDADVYLYRWILHDWPDERATMILRNLVPSLRKGTSVLIQEFVLPEPGMIPSYFEKTLRCIDMSMKAAFNAKERGLDDWKQLVANADERFEFVGCKVPADSQLAVLHFIWKGN